MESLDFISKLLDGRVVFGKREEISPNLVIIPVYKVKISFFSLSTDLKSNSGDGNSGSISVTPICLLEILNNDVKILPLDSISKKEGIIDALPDMLGNIDIGSILKGIKIN